MNYQFDQKSLKFLDLPARIINQTTTQCYLLSTNLSNEYNLCILSVPG